MLLFRQSGILLSLVFLAHVVVIVRRQTEGCFGAKRNREAFGLLPGGNDFVHQERKSDCSRLSSLHS